MFFFNKKIKAVFVDIRIIIKKYYDKNMMYPLPIYYYFLNLSQYIVIIFSNLCWFFFVFYIIFGN